MKPLYSNPTVNLRFLVSDSAGDAGYAARPRTEGSYVTTTAPHAGRRGTYVTTNAAPSGPAGTYVTTSAPRPGPAGSYVNCQRRTSRRQRP